MKYVRYEAGGKASYGVLEGNTIKQMAGSPFKRGRLTGKTVRLSDVKLLAPCEPTKILAIGLNYSSHLHGREAPKEPMVFYKTPTSLVGPGDTIVRPKGTAKLDAEAELVVVIKDRCRNVSKADAMKHVFGYTCGNDVSARDWQRDDRNWWRAKSADTFSPAGPHIETELNPGDVRVSGKINGKVVQSETTKFLIFDVPTLVEWCSKFVTLEPGDMIYTGTPGEPGEMKDGDTCEIEIQGIGSLRNPVKLER